MKKYFILLLINSCFINAIAQDITKATLVLTPFNMTSIIAVSCDEFESNFEDVKKVIEIKKENYSTLSNLLNIQINEKGDHINTRGKLLMVFENGNVKTICFDKFGVFYDGSKYFKNVLLFQFILDIRAGKY